MERAADRYRRLLSRLDAWFRERSAARPGVVPCKAGCSACCYGPFDISVADAALLRVGIAKLDPAARAAAIERARALMEKVRALAPEWGPPWDVRALPEEAFDRLCDALEREPCPLLDDAGRCRVYEDRPLVCRMIGLPMVTPAGRVIENACPIKHEFPEYEKMEPQRFPLEILEEEEAALLDAAARELGTDAGFETIIAAWIAGGGPASGPPVLDR